MCWLKFRGGEGAKYQIPAVYCLSLGRNTKILIRPTQATWPEPKELSLREENKSSSNNAFNSTKVNNLQAILFQMGILCSPINFLSISPSKLQCPSVCCAIAQTRNRVDCRLLV